MNHYTPFNDNPQVIYVPTDSSTGGIDTHEIDQFRQGVEIRTNHQRFIGNQPKIWSGNLEHTVDVTTIGQARSFVEFDNSLLFGDLPEFDPVAYIQMGPSYPLPIIFNDGPQKEEEAYMEPLTFPFRKWTPEGPFYAHRVAGTVEDGNDIDTIYRNSNRTEQFQDYLDPLQNRHFLDEGSIYWGPIENSIKTPGWIPGTERTLRPFDDTTYGNIPKSLKSANSSLVSILMKMNMNLDGDIRPSQTRSANANTFIYGRDAAIYGTDSIAFSGMTRGS